MEGGDFKHVLLTYGFAITLSFRFDRFFFKKKQVFLHLNRLVYWLNPPVLLVNFLIFGETRHFCQCKTTINSSVMFYLFLVGEIPIILLPPHRPGSSLRLAVVPSYHSCWAGGKDWAPHAALLAGLIVFYQPQQEIFRDGHWSRRNRNGFVVLKQPTHIPYLIVETTTSSHLYR